MVRATASSSPKKPKLRSWKRRMEDIDIDIHYFDICLTVDDIYIDILPNYPTVDHNFDNYIIMDYIDINLLPNHPTVDRIDTCKLQLWPNALQCCITSSDYPISDNIDRQRLNI